MTKVTSVSIAQQTTNGMSQCTPLRQRAIQNERTQMNEDRDDENQIETAQIKARYNRIAPVYDRVEAMSERIFRPWREKLWSYARGNILEIGVGTGKNFPFYPRHAKVIGIDFAEKMLAHARERAHKSGLLIDLWERDVQALDFCDDSFDTAAATFVFCSVPDPLRGLRELNRVVKPDGRILLLEHVRINHPLIGRIMDLLNPLVVRLWGANINRRTVENARRAGLEIERVEHLGPMQMVKLIVAKPGKLKEQISVRHFES